MDYALCFVLTILHSLESAIVVFHFYVVAEFE